MISKLSPDILRYASLLSLDGGKSTATGFLITFESNIVLITARHVLFNKFNIIEYNTLIVTTPCLDMASDKKLMLQIDLKGTKALFHPSLDACCILIGVLEGEANTDDIFEVDYHDYVEEIDGLGLNIFSTEPDSSKTLNNFIIGNDAYLFGYPSSLGLQNDEYFDRTEPLIRKGIIAGVNKKKHTFIIDCPSYYGNSGSPVIIEYDNGDLMIGGLVSRFVPLEISWTNVRDQITNREYSNSGYTICIPMDVILPMVSDCINNSK